MEARVEHLKSCHEILRATLKRAAREPGGAGAGRMPEAPMLAEALRQELGRMCQEHRQIADGLRELARAAHAQGRSEYDAFIEEMMVHARTEETMLYPAAIVAGEYAGLLSR